MRHDGTANGAAATSSELPRRARRVTDMRFEPPQVMDGRRCACGHHIGREASVASRDALPMTTREGRDALHDDRRIVTRARFRYRSRRDGCGLLEGELDVLALGRFDVGGDVGHDARPIDQRVDQRVRSHGGDHIDHRRDAVPVRAGRGDRKRFRAQTEPEVVAWMRGQLRAMLGGNRQLDALHWSASNDRRAARR